MYLLAISGGPDSIFLLKKYAKKNILVAHVNYNMRDDSNIDQQIVESFCKENNIKCFVLDIKEAAPKQNFQNWARETRYNFFKKIYDQNNCTKLLTGHHKDDFLESALMQNKANKEPKYFGIKDKQYLYGMKIYRPFIKRYWKHEILRYLNDNNIKFAVDKTNDMPIYDRNKIRIEIKKMSFSEKKDLFGWFVLSNKILVKKYKKVEKLFELWKATEYNLRFFRTQKYKKEMVFEYIHNNFEGVKLSSKKISSIVDFIVSPEGGKIFKLDENNSITKKKEFLIII